MLGIIGRLRTAAEEASSEKDKNKKRGAKKYTPRVQAEHERDDIGLPNHPDHRTPRWAISDKWYEEHSAEYLDSIEEPPPIEQSEDVENGGASV